MCTYSLSNCESALLVREKIIILIQGTREHILILDHLIHE
jgi:hypothetical protein